MLGERLSYYSATLATLACCGVAFAGAHPARADFEVVALQGEPAPGPAGTTWGDSFFNPVIMEAGEIYFSAAINVAGTPTSGVFVADSTGVVTTLALLGAPIQGQTETLGDAYITGANASGTVLVWVQAFGLPGLFKIDATGTIEAVALAENEAPDAGGLLFAAFLDADINDAGNIAFAALLYDGASTFTIGVYRVESTGALTTIAVGTPSGVLPAGDIGIDDQGTVTYGVGPLTSGGDVSIETLYSFSGTGPATQKLAIGAPVPGTGATLVELDRNGIESVFRLEEWSTTGAGDVPLFSRLSDGDWAHIVLDAAGNLDVRFTLGDPVPPPGTGTILGAWGTDLNSSLDLVSIVAGAYLTVYPGSGGPPEIRMQAGDPVPGFPGLTFQAFRGFSSELGLADTEINDAGDIAFVGFTNPTPIRRGLFVSRGPAISTPALPLPALVAFAVALGGGLGRFASHARARAKN